MEDTPLINILCYELPKEVGQPLFKEFHNRWDEIERIWQTPNFSDNVLKKHASTIKMLLAMSLYYRRVISGFYGATDFFKKITYEGNERHERAVKIGSFVFDRDQNYQLWKIQQSFSAILEKYQINETFFDFDDTLEFLSNCVVLYSISDGTKEDTPV